MEKKMFIFKKKIQMCILHSPLGRSYLNIFSQCNIFCSHGIFPVYVLLRLVIGTEVSKAVYKMLVI